MAGKWLHVQTLPEYSDKDWQLECINSEIGGGVMNAHRIIYRWYQISHQWGVYGWWSNIVFEDGVLYHQVRCVNLDASEVPAMYQNWVKVANGVYRLPLAKALTND